MRKLTPIIKEFLIPKIKFALTSSIATLLDYGVYYVLVTYLLTPIKSHVISYSVGMITNFILQKKFIFLLNRKLINAFVLSLSFSLIGLGISTLFMYLLNLHEFFNNSPYITKIIVVGMIFFYNFYTKRFSFEKIIVNPNIKAYFEKKDE